MTFLVHSSSSGCAFIKSTAKAHLFKRRKALRFYIQSCWYWLTAGETNSEQYKFRGVTQSDVGRNVFLRPCGGNIPGQWSLVWKSGWRRAELAGAGVMGRDDCIPWHLACPCSGTAGKQRHFEVAIHSWQSSPQWLVTSSLMGNDTDPHLIVWERNVSHGCKELKSNSHTLIKLYSSGEKTFQIDQCRQV